MIKEDPKNKNILYVGTDHGLYISLDEGNTFMGFNGGMPAVAVHDLVIHPRDRDIVIATHGRSLYSGSVKEVQELTAEVLAKDIQVFELNSVNHSAMWGRKFDEIFEPSYAIPYYSKNAGKVDISIKSEGGLILKQFSDDAEAGLNYKAYDLSIDDAKISAYQAELSKAQKVTLLPADSKKVYLHPGKYTVEVVSSSGVKSSQVLTVVSGGRGQVSLEPEAEAEPEGPETK